MRRGHRKNIPARIGMIILLLSLLSMVFLTFADLRLKPVVINAARSRARLFASDVISRSVDAAVAESTGSFINVIYGEDGISAIETNVTGISRLRADSILNIRGEISDIDRMTLDIPLGNLAGGMLLTGRGIPVRIKLVPIGDVSGEIYSEFSETGINQTLHRIYLRVRVSMNMIVASDTVRLELADDILVAETVIVGKVPDAYTAINRFEIDENEENDLNDYAAQLP
ncbi:MAG: sporulation protein YunB [Candidatus Flemingibacterium sp.]|nr:sporulation protein YunB [Candidatus Flemingibacterium sp.]